MQTTVNIFVNYSQGAHVHAEKHNIENLREPGDEAIARTDPDLCLCTMVLADLSVYAI